MIVRAAKGFYMFWMFTAYALGIGFELVAVIPVIMLWQAIAGRSHMHMQRAHRALFSLWLVFMKLGRLLEAGPYRGKIHDGPCIIIANHPGLFDVLFLIRDIPGMAVLVKPSLARKLPLGPVFRQSGYVLSNYGSESPLQTVQEIRQIVKEGYKFQLFPEGTRSPAGELLPFNAGAFKLAQSFGIPVQPLLIRNDPPFLPKGAPWYLPPREVSKVEIEFWEPVHVPEGCDIKSFAVQMEERYRGALGYPVVRRSREAS